MNVLHPFNQDLNPYVSVVQAGLRQAGIQVTSSTLPFWQGEGNSYDLVHFQWPETLFDWRAPSEVELLFLKQRLAELKGKTPLVFTHHNEKSNHITPENQPRLDELYGLLMDTADAVVHLGDASKPATPSLQTHAVIPIPVYEDLYAPYLGLTQSEARSRLHLPPDKQIILCFGNFRYDAEMHLVKTACAQIRNKHTLLDAPKWFKPRDLGFSVLHPFFCLSSCRKIIDCKRRGIRAGAIKIMDDEQVALHFAACDLVFLQRTRQLNSGNLPMAFLFGKVAVGPDFGNIGAWLKATGQPFFNPDIPASATDALRAGLELSTRQKGQENLKFAMQHWRTAQIGAAHAALYRSLG